MHTSQRSLPGGGNNIWLVSRQKGATRAYQNALLILLNVSVPNLAANITILSAYGVVALLQIGLGAYFRTWTFLIAVAGGCLVECAGYASRIAEHYNVWDDAAFKVQLVCLIIAPSFIAAGVYISFKHIVAYMGPEASRIPPRFYTWVFISFDVLSLIVQAAGGAMAASAEDGSEELETGNSLIIAGIGIQVGTMSICGVLALDFFIRHSRMKKVESSSDLRDVNTRDATGHRRFKIFLSALIFAFFVILARCIYRYVCTYVWPAHDLD